MERVHNFSAGPCILSESVLKRAQADLVSHPELGMSVMEISHRSAFWVAQMEKIEADVRSVLGVSDEYAVLFLTGGASTQFASVPLNLSEAGDTISIVDTGTWTAKAIKEAQHLGRNVDIAGSSKETTYDRIPEELTIAEDSKYLHYASNNTIYGTEFADIPDPRGKLLVCDASSNIFSRPLDVSRFDLIFAGAQKNLGPAGVTLVLVKKELLKPPTPGVPTMLNYKIHADKGSMYNTPPVFPIYMAGLTLEWLKEIGGLEEMAKINDRKAGHLYDVIDASSFYAGHAHKDARSSMNVTFRLATPELDDLFVKGAESEGLLNVRGHRSVGGIRASLYNAMPERSVIALAAFMREFERTRG